MIYSATAALLLTDSFLLANAATVTTSAEAHRQLLSIDDVQSGWSSFKDNLQCSAECLSSLVSNWDGEVSRACWTCMNHPTIGQLPFSATSDLLQFKLGVGYTEGWCGRSRTFCENAACASEGVDITRYPTGWRPDGTGCEIKTNFPGINATSHMSHAYVKKEMATLPRLQYEGKVWRGNELGFIISNELFWPNVSPRSVGLGASVAQHMVMRPILDRTLGSCDASCTAALQQSVKAWQAARTSVDVQPDIVAWVHEELFKRLFPGEPTLPVPASEFVSLQSSLATLSTITQLLSDDLSNLIAGSTLTKLQAAYEAYLPLVEKVYGAELANADCSPMTDCVALATSNLLDVLFFAGGLSVPSGISTGLWVLHADTSAYGETFPQQPAVGDPATFFYESIRFFPPVVGFPWWTTPPERASDDTKSQTAGGVRKILNLALANKDPNAWGSDAHQFRVRKHSDYAQNFVGFADYAYDNSVAEGKMNRHCPAKQLALQMGKAFFTEWDQEGWCTRDASDYQEATPFVDPFKLYRGRRNGHSCSPNLNPFGTSECCVGGCYWEWSGWFRGSFKCMA
jgi:hypothetical protein